ncbi:uncharacterized protein At5g01610-like [Wolffia australiana]
MAPPSAVDSYRNNAEVSHGEAACKKMLAELLKDLGLPVGLLPFNELTEVGYSKEEGFLWVVQKKKVEHNFKAINQLVSYATEITAMVEPRKIKKLTGVKTREMLIWLSVVEVYINDPASGKITFKTRTGLSDTFPVSAFQPKA